MEPQQRNDPAALLREVLETRNQMIKTANAVTGLSTEIRELSRAQQRRARGRTMGSLATYALFLGIVAAGFFFTYRARMDRLAMQHDLMVRQHKALADHVRDLERQLAQRDKTGAQAYEYYALLSRGKINAAIARYPEVARLPLTRVEAAVFRDQVGRHREQLAYRAYNAGVRAFAEKDWARTAAELRQSLSLVPAPPHAAPLHFHLGLALTRLGNYTEAAAAMERALAADAEKLFSREVRYHLATVYEQLGQRGKARAAYAEYLRRNPSGSLARSARARVKALAD